MSLLPSSWLVTFLLLAAVGALCYELYRRLFLSFDDNIPTVVLPMHPPPAHVEDLHVWDTELLLKHKTTVMRVINMFKPWNRTLLVADPAVAKEIFAGPNWEKFQRPHWSQDYHMFHAGGMILMPNGQEWREAREHLGTRTFSSTTVRTYVPILREQFAFLRRKIEEEIDKNGGKIDIQHLYNNFTFDVICRLTFGESVNAQTTDEGTRYLEAWDNLLEYSNILVAIKGLLHPTFYKLFPGIVNGHKDAYELVSGLIRRNVARHRNGEDKRVSILDDFLNNAKVPGWLKEDSQLEKQMMTFLFAGHDTTAGLLSFLTHELAIHPEWQSRAREEVLAAFGPGNGENYVTELEKLETLPVLNACIKETLRMYPSAPVTGGRAMYEDFVYQYTDSLTKEQKRIDLRTGDQVLPFLYAMQRHPDMWDKSFGSPDEFNPERFIKDPVGGAISLYAFSPFGNGARKCAGERLALGEARLSMAEILRRYEWVPQDGHRLEQAFSGTIKAKHGVKIVIKRLVA
ncbi:cytochrome P450 [Hyaloraphidium curvatum]|nr:cytochrome P450 [Hyaloraphidium curvatum]